MIFGDIYQKWNVCYALLQPLGLDHLWTPEGPSPDGQLVRETRGSTLDARQYTIFNVCWSLWFESGGATVADLALHLRADDIANVATLFAAIATGAAAVDEWVGTELRRRSACAWADTEQGASADNNVF